MTVRPPLQTFASATLFAALCLAQPFALAQQNGGNGKGTLTIEGEVTDSTCVINFKDATASTQAASSSTLKLTPVKRADLALLSNPGDELTATPAKFTIVSLGTSTAGTSCSLDNGNSFWDFEINAQSTTIIGSNVLLSSVAAENGSSASRSNVLVQLKAKVIDDVNTVATPDTSGAENVKPINSEKLGVQLSNASGLTATQGFAIGAVYVRPDGTPTAGSFSSPITLSVKYP
jgi:type 1 fimbria pilin